jgi:hypothetical protein
MDVTFAAFREKGVKIFFESRGFRISHSFVVLAIPTGAG